MSDFKKITDFKKSKSSKYAYQDPTYLSFVLLFDFTDAANSPFLSKPAENFLAKLAKDDDYYAEKLEALFLFKKALITINNEMPWYWQGISGLERLQQYDPQEAYFGGPDAKITIETLESLNLPIAGLMHLYRKATFDERKWTYVLPANLRKFRMYAYVTEVRSIANLSKPTLSGISLNDFPDNFKPSFGLKNDNEGISGTAARPYFMFGLKHCEFDLHSGTSAFADLKKSPEAPAVGEISFSYETLYSVEARVLNGIVKSTYNTDNLSPSPDSEDDSPSSMLDWAVKKVGSKLGELKDRAVTDLKLQANQKVGELKQQAKDATVGRLNVAVNNIFQDFVGGVDDALNPTAQASNISSAIADNVYGGLAPNGSTGITVQDALNGAAQESLGNVYGD